MSFKDDLEALDHTSLNEVQLARMLLLIASPFSNDDCANAWSQHDAIVNHRFRNGVDLHELPYLVSFVMMTFPVVVYRECKTVDGEPYSEFVGLALDASMTGYTRCAVVVTRKSPEFVFETCIADEDHLPELLHLLDDPDKNVVGA